MSPSARRDAAEIAALVLAIAGVAGSLALSIVLGFKACPLCFYQRSFVMAAAGTLLLAWPWRRALPEGLVAALVLFPAVAGLGVAAFHVYLEATGTLECPPGLFDLGSSPQQSLLLFALLVPTLAMAARPRTALFAAVLGALAAWGSIASAPPLPATPKAPYPASPEICRPPYLGEGRS
jgi:disulfide bond formation protein DsbB